MQAYIDFILCIGDITLFHSKYHTALATNERMLILHYNDCKTGIDTARNLTGRLGGIMPRALTATPFQSHDGDVLYAWLRLEDPFCWVCAGLDGDH
jgi:hypothetical protein